MENLRAKFKQIRDIPYYIPLSSGEEDFCCTGKHKLFLEYLQQENYEARWRVCAFNWGTMNLPDKVLAIPHDDSSTHAYLEVLINEKWIKVDLTWDAPLSKILSINEWDGISDTTIAVPVLVTYSVEDSAQIIQHENKLEVEADLKINGAFYKAFNDWLQEERTI